MEALRGAVRPNRLRLTAQEGRVRQSAPHLWHWMNIWMFTCVYVYDGSRPAGAWDQF